jgi:glycosyltransferase involved in cell wall biosynthesis
MKILTLTYEYPPVGGGGGQVAQDICQGLAALGHDVQVLTAHWGDLPMQEEQKRVLVRRIRSGRREPYRADLVAMAGYILAGVPAAVRLCRNWKPDVIHVHFAVPTGAAAWAVSKLTGVPYVLTAHLGDVPGGVPEKTGMWFRFIYPFTPPIWRGAARIAAVSAFTRGLALEHYDVPIEIIYNGVDLKAIDPGEIQVNDPPRIVFAGRFMEQKDPLQLMRTLGALRDLPWNCTMMGDGPLRRQVEEEIKTQGLEDRFNLPGWIKPHEVLEWYRKADLMFMPSRSEGLPVVGVQAAAMGLALVLSRVGGCVDIIEQGENGFLVEPGDAAGYEQGLRELLSDPARLLEARRASRSLASRFDIEKVVGAYIDLFAEAADLGRAGSAPEE